MTIHASIAETPADQPPIAVSPDGETDARAPAHEGHALIADDTAVMAKLLAGTLTRLGYSFDRAQDGQEALMMASQTRYDVILMDIMMPKMDGLAATHAIRRLPGERGDVPIIAVSTKMSVPEVESYLAVGMTDVIKKPVNSISLQALFDKHLKSDADCTAATSDREIWQREGAVRDELDILNWNTLNCYGELFKSGMIGILEDFLHAAPPLIADMGKAVARGDDDSTCMFAHQLKSTAEVFGAETLSDLAARLEILAGNGETRRAPVLFAKLRAAYVATESALKKKLVLLKNMG
ncbi:response regulator [Kordiimonas marina]|uniref:response regulator n=1 Tax=Kordiimonas marina TaxID=2872312 RepID=UPI001FF3CD97|nr:response regulator [Kordiimonas marina]MCJ9428706.1 response regulator [Kordiimonas marina]